MSWWTNFMLARPSIDGLYVHVPFCEAKCHYCAFYSVRLEPGVVSGWLAALQSEVGAMRTRYDFSALSTLFIGGGTPTLLDLEHWTILLPMIHSLLGTRSAPDARVGLEWSCEANPGSFSPDKARRLREAGVNRLSLGVQSLDDAVLARLGRRHRVAEVRESVRIIKEVGFPNWSLDLIACVPGVSQHAWRRTLEEAVALGPRHISIYALTAEEGSRLAAECRGGEYALLADEEQLAMLDEAESTLGAAGYSRYEISNYAQPGYECRHNRDCWEGKNYVGLGCAASSRVGNLRWSNRSDLASYIQAMRTDPPDPGFRTEDPLSPVMDATERLVFGLRMMQGVDLEAILATAGVEGSPHARQWRHALERLESTGLVCRAQGRWRLTPRGIALADHVAVELMP